MNGQDRQKAQNPKTTH